MNVSEEAKQSVIRNTQCSNHYNCFDEAINEIYNLMEGSSLPSFLQSNKHNNKLSIKNFWKRS